jgi:hypothetical protein
MRIYELEIKITKYYNPALTKGPVVCEGAWSMGKYSPSTSSGQAGRKQ